MVLGISVYTWTVIVAVGLALLLRGDKKGSTVYIFLVSVALFCVLGLRNGITVGADGLWYYHYYERLKDVAMSAFADGKINEYNWLFYRLMKLEYDLTNGDFHLFIMLLAAFEMFSVFHMIKKHSVSPVFSFLCFFGFFYYLLMFSILKQAAAMAVLMWAFDAIVEKRPFRFLVLVLLAGSFHFPALVFLPAYWIGNMKIERHYLLVLAGFLLIVFLLRDQIIALMSAAYLSGESTAIQEDEQIRFLANKVLVMILIVVLGLALRQPNRRENAAYPVLLQLMGVAIILQTFAGYGNIFERLADYYYQFVILFVPMIFEKNKNIRSRLPKQMAETARTFVPYLICVFAIWRYLTNAGVTPYYFYFDPVPEGYNLSALIEQISYSL